MLIRKKLTEAEFSNPALRYDETCDCVQFSPDGGTTWIDQPANDPRTSDAYRLPALSGGDAQCRAAEGMRALVEQFVNERIETDTAIELAGGILGIIAFIPGFNVLYALILAFASLAVTIARELLEAAFTEEIYDQIRCTFYCHIGTDGQMSQGQFDDAYAEFDNDTKYPNAITQLWVHAVMDLVGCVGLSDAGVKLEAAADCDECACDHCFTIDFSVEDGSAYGVANSGVGSWNSGQGWVGNYQDGSSQNTVTLIWTFPETINLVSASVEYEHAGGGGANNGAVLRALNPVVSYNSVQIAINNDINYGDHINKGVAPGDDAAGISMDLNSGDVPYANVVYSFTVVYTGDIPDGWSDNCG